MDITIEAENRTPDASSPSEDVRVSLARDFARLDHERAALAKERQRLEGRIAENRAHHAKAKAQLLEALGVVDGDIIEGPPKEVRY